MAGGPKKNVRARRERHRKRKESRDVREQFEGPNIQGTQNPEHLRIMRKLRDKKRSLTR